MAALNMPSGSAFLSPVKLRGRETKHLVSNFSQFLL